ncbi:MAG: PPK2 family polyphosphate:nucleotide phosphotransferase [Ilumatobacter sp.]|jgi:PPK2 family polyphosphate:nucleotide phosphotransferase
MAKNIVEELRVDGDPHISTRDTADTFGWEREEAEALFAEEMVELVELQKKLFADKSASLLVVLQAMDAAGKDSTIRAVMSGLNPAGVDVQPFGVPTEEEQGHDYLWRIHSHAPEDGYITVFNRSHYEDVLVVRVKGFASEKVWEKRYDHIRNFEQMLADEGTHIVKIFLNVSKEKQKERFEERLERPDKRWKFRAGDLDDRALWDDYMDAYTVALEKTSTDDAPWYVVPADKKWARNVCIARILRHHLEKIDPKYPEPDGDIDFGDIVVT